MACERPALFGLGFASISCSSSGHCPRAVGTHPVRVPGARPCCLSLLHGLTPRHHQPPHTHLVALPVWVWRVPACGGNRPLPLLRFCERVGCEAPWGGRGVRRRRGQISAPPCAERGRGSRRSRDLLGGRPANRGGRSPCEQCVGRGIQEGPGCRWRHLGIDSYFLNIDF